MKIGYLLLFLLIIFSAVMTIIACNKVNPAKNPQMVLDIYHIIQQDKKQVIIESKNSCYIPQNCSQEADPDYTIYCYTINTTRCTEW